MQMTRLGSSVIPGLLIKSWYVTRCSVNFSDGNNFKIKNKSGRQTFQRVIKTDNLTHSALTFGDLAGVALSPTEGHADVHVVAGGI